MPNKSRRCVGRAPAQNRQCIRRRSSRVDALSVHFVATLRGMQCVDGTWCFSRVYCISFRIGTPCRYCTFRPLPWVIPIVSHRAGSATLEQDEWNDGVPTPGTLRGAVVCRVDSRWFCASPISGDACFADTGYRGCASIPPQTSNPVLQHTAPNRADCRWPGRLAHFLTPVLFH